ncbi:MAG TPA: Stealth CR1 domain-containing protein [Candidatus Pullichristensenella excrementigallinarum]|uniref:Stealth CR1 domain-containing protein n=1 Tax=Candidatus Pullichristensenella excrementigallinarum TaxID=2840907 RepID=A0A9D1I9J2_9FIRM|nr:Stealth CR1 domain-containing protein [Candidatus Pullichristensenella excrementigallinarum]
MKSEPVDFVMPWVDGGDPEWRRVMHAYRGDTYDEAEEQARYRDWDNLKYWFRGVEKFAPWVRRVHFITMGHLPAWLNPENPKLHIVRHEDYIPEEYLPTFSANPIELNLHRIADLSERFVYFNDDTFILRPVSEDLYFRNGLPCDYFGYTQHYCPSEAGLQYMHILVNNAAYVNLHFNKRACQKAHWRKFLSPKYGWKRNLRTLYYWGLKNFTGFSIPHMPTAYLKKTYEEVWEKAPGILERTSAHRFRTFEDVSHNFFRCWRLVKGEFYPFPMQGRHFSLSSNPQKNEEIARVIRSQQEPMICLNDVVADFNFETEKQRMIAAFESILPEKSSFEK